VSIILDPSDDPPGRTLSPLHEPYPASVGGYAFRMKILLVGAGGTIGQAVFAALRDRHDVVSASRRAGDHRVDIDDPSSIRDLYHAAGVIDAVVCCAGGAGFAPLQQLTDDQWRLSVESKLMGQINLVRYGIDHVAATGSFTLTSGILATQPAPGTAAITAVNAALEGFTRAAALDLNGGPRINCVSPGWVSETLAAMGRDPSNGTPAATVAKRYVDAVEGKYTGQVLAAVGRP
jgi:NAD(P)-dependent dehydrogenase (short-subunit alcohol dehydrogenase family)